MFALAKLAVLLSVAISVAAMPSHLARQGHHHREIAARVAQPEDVPAIAVVPGSEIAGREIPLPAKRVVRKKRARDGRCSSSLPPSSTLNAENLQPSPTPGGNERKDPDHTSTTPKDPEPSTSTPDQPDPNTSPEPTPTPTPEPTPTPTPTPTTTPTPTPTPDNSGSGGGQVHTGQGTFYSTGLGACGITNNDNQDIAAVSHLFFDTFPGYDGTNPNNNPMCGKTAKVTFQGKTVFVALTDRCEGCAYDDLDFSPHAFNQLADPSLGRISGIQWELTN